MGGRSKPKQSDYKPSQAESTQAAIAKAEADYFRKTYDPLLVEMRDKAAKEDVGATLRGRAQADTYQTLTGGGANLTIAKSINNAGDLATAATGQMLQANTAAKDAKVTQQVGVLGTARGQQADAGDALAQASKLARSEDLTKIKAKQDVRLARNAAAFKIGMAGASQGLENLGSTGDFFRSDIGMRYNPANKSWERGSVGPLGRKQKWEVYG